MTDDDSAEDDFADVDPADENMALALAVGGSQRAVASRCGVSESTVARRMRDPRFRARVRFHLDELVDRAIGSSAALVAEANNFLAEVVRGSVPDASLAVRVRAAVELRRTDWMRYLRDIDGEGE